MTGRDACPTIENDAVVQIVWHGFRPLRSVPRVPLGSRSAWKSDAIDSLMPEETPARLGLRQRVFLAQAPAAEIRGPRRFCQPLLSAVICAKFSTRRKLPKALWEKEFNASTLKNHPHDFEKTHKRKAAIFYAGCGTHASARGHNILWSAPRWHGMRRRADGLRQVGDSIPAGAFHRSISVRKGNTTKFFSASRQND